MEEMSNLKYTISKCVPSSWRRADFGSEATFYLGERKAAPLSVSAFMFCPILDLIAKPVWTFVFVHLSFCCSPFQITVSFCFTLSASHCNENCSLQMRLIILENKTMFQLPSALNPLQSRCRVYFISLAAHNIFNHKSYTLVDPLDVEECFEQLGFAFKELLRREIRLVLPVAGRSHTASPHYFSPHCSVPKTNKQNAKCVCMLIFSAKN